MYEFGLDDMTRGECGLVLAKTHLRSCTPEQKTALQLRVATQVLWFGAETQDDTMLSDPISFGVYPHVTRVEVYVNSDVGRDQTQALLTNLARELNDNPRVSMLQMDVSGDEVLEAIRVGALRPMPWIRCVLASGNTFARWSWSTWTTMFPGLETIGRRCLNHDAQWVPSDPEGRPAEMRERHGSVCAWSARVSNVSTYWSTVDMDFEAVVDIGASAPIPPRAWFSVLVRNGCSSGMPLVLPPECRESLRSLYAVIPHLRIEDIARQVNPASLRALYITQQEELLSTIAEALDTFPALRALHVQPRADADQDNLSIPELSAIVNRHAAIRYVLPLYVVGPRRGECTLTREQPSVEELLAMYPPYPQDDCATLK